MNVSKIKVWYFSCRSREMLRGADTLTVRPSFCVWTTEKVWCKLKWSKESESAVAECVWLDQVSVCPAEKPDFRQLLQQWNNRYVLPSRNYFMYTELPALHNDTKILYHYIILASSGETFLFLWTSTEIISGGLHLGPRLRAQPAPTRVRIKTCVSFQQVTKDVPTAEEERKRFWTARAQNHPWRVHTLGLSVWNDGQISRTAESGLCSSGRWLEEMEPQA